MGNRGSNGKTEKSFQDKGANHAPPPPPPPPRPAGNVTPSGDRGVHHAPAPPSPTKKK